MIRIAVLLIILFTFVTTSLYSKTIQVPADRPTIRDGIDVAAKGDTVLVAPGTYKERINFKGKAIRVKSSDGAEYTVIDGRNKGTVVTFNSWEGSDSVLQGFTIINGNSSNGGGIYCSDSSPTITNNVISDNYSEGDGGGISCWGFASPTIEGNQIIQNKADGGGGGISCDAFCSPEILNNTINNNRSGKKWQSGIGGGIFCWNNCSPTVVGNKISGNWVEYGLSKGGGIYVWNSSATIVDNTLSGNWTEAGGDGGGIYSSDSVLELFDNFISENRALSGDGGGIGSVDSDLTLTNNIIVANFAKKDGGGIYIRGSCEVILNNVTLAGNTAATGYGLNIGSLADVEVFNSILWDDPLDEIYNESSDFQVTYSDVWGHWAGIGNIDTDPLFVDQANNDCHLTFNSPCRGSGDNTVIGLPNYDFEGDPRISQETVDMGADEFHTHLYYIGDAMPGGGIEGKLVGLPGSYPTGLWFSLAGVLVRPVQTQFGAWYLNSPWIQVYPLSSIPATGVLAITERLPLYPAPYDIPMQALIGLNSDSLTNLCVLEVR